MIIVSMPIVDGVDFSIRHDHFQQMANQIYSGLKARNLDVLYVTPKDPFPIVDLEKDFCICDWSRLDYCSRFFPKNRIILFDNCNFNYQNLDGYYTKYGFMIPTNTSPHVKIDLLPHLIGLRGAVFMSNDVAIAKIADNHPDIKDSHEWWVKNVGDRLKIIPHAIDKEYWAQYFNPEAMGSRILVYSKGGKNSYEYIQLLKQIGYQEGAHYDVTNHINKGNPLNLINLNADYFAIVNCSFSETGPINMIEYQFQGLLVIGMEEWWTGYGEPKTVWTYDPNRYSEMGYNIHWLLNNKHRENIRLLRNRIHTEQMARKDNEWNYVIDKLIECM